MKKRALMAMLEDAIDQLDLVDDEAELTAALNAERTRASQAENRLRVAQAEVETMKQHWRPVPLQHEWEPRDYRCSLCDDPRDSPRHTATPRVNPDWPSLSFDTLRVALDQLDANLTDDWTRAVTYESIRQAAEEIRALLSQVDGEP